MRCEECITNLPADVKQSIERVWRTDLVKLGEEGLDYLSLERLMKHKKVVHSVFQGLNRLERELLKCIILNIGYEPFSINHLEKTAHMSYISGAECRVAIIRLQQKGIIFTFKKAWDEAIYVMPVDCFPLWLDTFFSPILMEEDDLSQEMAHSFISRHPGVSYSIVSLLSYAGMNGLKLTQKGTIQKRQLAPIHGFASFNENDLQPLNLKYAYQDTYSISTAVLLDLALRLGLLAYGTEEMIIQTKQLQNWLKLNVNQAELETILTFFDAYIPPDREFQQVWMSLWLLPKQSWIPIKRFIAWLEENGITLHKKTSPTDTSEENSSFSLEENIVEQAIRPLAAMGLVEAARDGQGQTHIKISLLLDLNRLLNRYTPSNPADPIFIQPDFEIIVPPSASLNAHWELLLMADLVQRDVVIRYRLTKLSIERACSHGRSAEEIIEFLQNCSQLLVPESVAQSISDWCNQYGSIVFEQVTLLRCRDTLMAEQLKNHEVFQQSIVEALSETDFIVKSDAVKQLEKWLAKQGFPSMGKGTNAERSQYLKVSSHEIEWNADIQQECDDAHQSNQQVRGIVYSKASIHYYQPVDRLPSVQDIYPHLKQVPSLWLASPRDYHPSVRKEMIEKALSYRAIIQLKKQGETKRFIPERLTEMRDGFKIDGYENEQRVTLSCRDWEEMQLILPGINDNNEE